MPANSSGRVVGFGSRGIPGTASDAAGLPKYLNSPETPLYRKGAHCYGLSVARDAIRTTDRVLVVEGYFDVLALAEAVVWAAGVRSAPVIVGIVALSGVVAGLNIPGWQAFVTELVPREHLLNAVTLNSAQFNASRAFGPALGGLVLAGLGVTWAFLINALSFIAVSGAFAGP